MRRPFLGGFLVLALILTEVALAQGKLVRLNDEQRRHLDVQTTLAEPVDTVPLAQAPGRVVLPPAKEFAVTSLQSGIITRVNVPLGVKVAKGQVLAEIDSIALVDLQRAVIDAHSVFSVAESRLRRDETLLREGVISKLRGQETRSEFERAQATLKAAEQTLLASGITWAEIKQLETSHRINGLYRVLAPVDGTVLARMAIVGQRVDTLAPLFRIGTLDELWLEVDMPQERLKEALIGDRVTVERPRARARVIEISQSVDPQSQSALVRARVEQGADQLRPGMQVNVQMMHRSTDRIFKVPIAAVFNHEGQNYVFVKRMEGFEPVQVEVAGQEAYNAVLHEGLQGGEAIVIQGVAALKAAWLTGGNARHGHGD